MTTLVAPPPPKLSYPPPSVTPAPELTLTSVPFHGRSFAEYVTLFALDPLTLRGKAVLDVGAGPSSFTTEAVRRGIDAVAVDPLYGCTLATLATHVQLDYARVTVDACKRLQGARLAAREALEADRRAAAQRFLADYESGFVHNRFVGGALPRLPFLDGAFDLVLCSHLLFAADTPFESASRVEACQELLRVSAGEVRVGPFSGLSTNEANELFESLRERGIAHRRTAVPGPLGSGRQTLLTLRRA